MPIGNPPGVICANFDNGSDKVFCHWEGGLDDTLLHFFGAEAGSLGLFASLDFDFFVNDLNKARVLARESWDQHREEIRGADGIRLYMREGQLNKSPLAS